jgi:hypothetical protein
MVGQIKPNPFQVKKTHPETERNTLYFFLPQIPSTWSLESICGFPSGQVDIFFMSETLTKAKQVASSMQQSHELKVSQFLCAVHRQLRA